VCFALAAFSDFLAVSFGLVLAFTVGSTKGFAWAQRSLSPPERLRFLLPAVHHHLRQTRRKKADAVWGEPP